MTKRAKGTALGCLLVVFAAMTAGSAAQLPRLSDLMRRKLEHAQHLLEAVVLQRPIAVERYAHELLLLSEASTWSPMPTTEYLSYAADFQEAARGLKEAAQERDLDAIPAAYMEVVTNCIQCHTHVKGAQRAVGSRADTSR